MARRVYFAFHYQDVASFRANVIRRSGMTQTGEFYDASLWEQVKKQGDLAIKRMINDGLDRTTVTAVLIGSKTYNRRWVRYEIAKSLSRSNGLVGVHINGVRDKYGYTTLPGPNPFDYLYFRVDYLKGKVMLWEAHDGQWAIYEEIPSIPLSEFRYARGVKSEGKLSALFPAYDWVLHDGYHNLGKWAEDAAQIAGR